MVVYTVPCYIFKLFSGIILNIHGPRSVWTSIRTVTRKVNILFDIRHSKKFGYTQGEEGKETQN